MGEKVGYSIRFENETSSSTAIKYMTEGILLRESLSDQYLYQYSVIIMDEAHERSLNTDILFGILKKLIQQRIDLKVIITSATMNSQKFSNYFNCARIFEIPGRTFPVDKIYLDSLPEDYIDAAVKKAIEIHLKEPPGDILMFLTGKEDIDFSCNLLIKRMNNLTNMSPMIVLPIYSMLPQEQQNLVF